MPTIQDRFGNLEPVGYSPKGMPVYCAIPTADRPPNAILHGTSYATLLGCAMLRRVLRDVDHRFSPAKKYFTNDFDAAVREAGRVCDVPYPMTPAGTRMQLMGIVPADIGLVIGFDANRVPDRRVPGMRLDTAGTYGSSRPGHPYCSTAAIWLTDIDPWTQDCMPELFQTASHAMFNSRAVTGPVIGTVNGMLQASSEVRR